MKNLVTPHDDRRDLWAWNLTLFISFLGIVAWSVLSTVLPQDSWGMIAALIFGAAALLRFIYSLSCEQSASRSWSLSGSFLFFFAAFACLRIGGNADYLLYVTAIAIGIDSLLGLSLGHVRRPAEQRLWLLLLAPMQLVPAFVLSLADFSSTFPLALSFMMTLAICIHSVCAFTIFLHMRKTLPGKERIFDTPRSRQSWAEQN